MTKRQEQRAEGKGHSVKRRLLVLCTMLIYLCAMLFLLPADCYAVSAQQKVNVANKFYRQGQIDEALQKYNEASISLPDSDVINFNMGAALYKKEDYQKAQDAFTKALTSDNKKIEADALYNMGNCKYKLGKLKENTDLSSTIGLLREALDYYKRAVEIDQKNTDARFNHEFVERELKILLDRLKQQENEKTKEQKNQKTEEQKQAAQEKQEQQKQGKSSADNGQGTENKEQRASGAEQGTENEEQTAESKEESGKGAEQTAAGEEGQDKELSEEGARALLERYGREEAEPDYMDKHAVKGYDREVVKDW